ncbi:hypothetical protein Tco_0167758 [Tanacetum coccineum]
MIKRFIMADDLKECSRITVKDKSKELCSKITTCRTKIALVLDALALTPFYRAFLITADVPAIYMPEFWATISVHRSSIKFTINKKKVSLDVDIFRDILQFCPKIPGHVFEDLPLEQDILFFIKDLGHTGEITYLTDVNVDYLHQPWRAFATVINKCLSALSPVSADLIPSPKRVRNFDYLADVEVDSRESSEPSRSRGTDIEDDDEIERVDESRGIDVRVVAKTVVRDEVGTDTRDIVEGGDDKVTHLVMPDDVQEVAQDERAAEGTYETLGSLVQRIFGVESAVTALTERITELERDNRRLRGTTSVEGQRVDRLQRGMSRMQRELRQIQRLQFYD